jgi:hypothetical protein
MGLDFNYFSPGSLTPSATTWRSIVNYGVLIRNVNFARDEAKALIRSSLLNNIVAFLLDLSLVL